MQWIERKPETDRTAPAIGMGTERAWARETVLLVEDENFVRDVTGEILQSAGYRVLKARNAADAMRTFRRYRDEVQLLLTDLSCPARTAVASPTISKL